MEDFQGWLVIVAIISKFPENLCEKRKTINIYTWTGGSSGDRQVNVHHHGMKGGGTFSTCAVDDTEKKRGGGQRVKAHLVNIGAMLDL